MPAPGKPHGNHQSAWYALLGLVLCALLFRSAFPAGYMPGPPGQGGGALAITLCTEHENIASGTVDAPDAASWSPAVAGTPGTAPHAPAHDAPGQACPFCAVVCHAVMPGPALPAVAATIVPEVVSALPEGAEPLPASVAGPPLGSRAPPGRTA